MTRLEELSKISNAVLTPHLNFNPMHKSKSVNFAGSQYGGELTDYEKAFRKRWCERQIKKIGYYGAVLSCGK